MNKLKHYHSTMKLTSIAVLALLLLMNACTADGGKAQMANSSSTEKRVVAGELIVNAVKGAEMLGVEMFADGMTKPFYGQALSSYENRGKMGFPLPRIPQQVRVIWRKNDDVRLTDGKITYGGPLAGDYTIPVATRIPESVFEDIRKNGGALRIKFRLKPDGVMLGWDVQRKGKYMLQSFMPGGDFLDTEY